MNVTEKTSVWAERNGVPVQTMTRNFREATADAGSLHKLAAAYGVTPSVDDEETRRLIGEALKAGYDGNSRSGTASA